MRSLLADAGTGMKATKALPSGAAATTTDAIDLGNITGDFRADVELLLQAPAMGATPMADGKTMTYAVMGSNSSDLSGPVILADKLLVQTGAGGVGVSAAEARWRPPTNLAYRYVGVRATGSTTGDASGSSMTLKAVF